MKKLLMVLATVVGVGCGTGWDDVPNAVIRPEVRDDSRSYEWLVAVTDAANEWNRALLYRQCLPAPFAISTDHIGHHPVRLIDPEDWTWGDWAGATTPDTEGGPPGAVEIRSDIGDPDEPFTVRYRAMLLHELGHALGLEHGDSSIMREIDPGQVLGGDDVNAAMEVLGCL